MDAQQYLQKLYRRLGWYFTDRDSKEIIEDYREMLDLGAAQGKSTAELCSALGSPAQVVASLLSEGKKPTFFCPNRLTAVHVLALVLGALLVAWGAGALYPPAALLLSVVFVLLTALRPRAERQTTLGRASAPAAREIAAIATGGLCLLMVSALLWLLPRFAQTGLPMPADRVGPFAVALLYTAQGLAALSFSLAYATSHERPLYRFAGPMNAVLFCACSHLISLLHNLSSLSELQHRLTLLALLGAAALLLALILPLVYHLIKRRLPWTRK